MTTSEPNKFASAMTAPKCLYCHKTLRKIGSARKNGANHKVPKKHQYHKKCYRDAMICLDFGIDLPKKKST